MKWVMRFLPVLLIGLLFGSCDRNPTSNPTQVGQTATTITVTVPNAPIRNFKNNQVTTSVQVNVTDSRGVAVPAQRIAFSLTKRSTTNASISAVNGANDSTDASGNLLANLAITLDTSEVITITAHLAANSGVSGSAACPVILLTDQIRSFTLTLGKSVLVARQGSFDTTTVIATVTDGTAGIPGLTIDFHVDSTRYAVLSGNTAVTDNSGQAILRVWNNGNNYSDSVRLSANIHGVVASQPNAMAFVYLKVQPLTQPTDIYMYWVNTSESEVFAQQGEIVERKFILWCQDANHNVIGGVQVQLADSGIGSVPNYTVTSAYGRDTVTWTNNGMLGTAAITGRIVQATLDKNGKGPVKILGPEVRLENKMPGGMQPNSGGISYPLLGTDETSASSAVLRISVRAPASNPRLRISYTNNILFATGNDSVQVTITVRDQFDQGVPGAVLNLATRHGGITATTTTDPSGTAREWLHDNGDTTGVAGDYLYVRYRAINISDSVRFFIYPLLTVSRLTLNGPTTHYAYPVDTLGFQANVFLSNNNSSYDSTHVYWETYPFNLVNQPMVAGGGSWLNAITKTGNGQTFNTYTMRRGLGHDSLVAWSYATGSSGQRVMTSQILYRTAGPITHFQFYIPAGSTTTLQVNGPAVQIYAVGRDTADNPFPNPQIAWGCDIGTVVPAGLIPAAPADTIAVALLSAGANAGSGKVWISALNGASDTLRFNVIASTPRTLTLNATSPIIQVRGTGGNEHTVLRAVVRDGNGNSVTNGTRVRFRIMNGQSFMTGGPDPAQRPYFNQVGTDSVITETSGLGEALATVSAGYHSGPVQLEAEVLRPEDSTGTGIIATLSNVQIVAGPPAQVSVGVNNLNGTQEGGGTWSIWVNATVRDRYTNPVADGYSVVFTVNPIQFAQVGLDTPATGNTGPTNQHIHGISFTRMSYQGQNSYDTVTVRASCISRDTNNVPMTVSDTIRFGLPLQSGTIQLNVSPSTFFFSQSPQRDIATHQVWAIVRDGYGQRVHGAPVLFDVQRGHIYKSLQEAQTNIYNPTPRADGTQLISGTNPQIYWPVNKRKTGNYTYSANPGLSWTDPNGFGAATVWIGGKGPSLAANPPTGEIFLDPQTLEITSEVTCRIEGDPTVQSARFVINYQRS